MSAPPFAAFPKIARYSREAIVTEKIDGTNGVRFVRRGDRPGYTGIGGFVYVNETEAKAIDAENSADSRYPRSK